MHTQQLEQWEHDHKFYLENEKGEKRSVQVLVLTLTAMVVEITAGEIFESMALIADGWHMATHAAALSISIFAYRYAKKHSSNPRFSFGTGKVTVLGGFTSGVALIAISVLMVLESVMRIMNPGEIEYFKAIIVASAGLTVNLICALLLNPSTTYKNEKKEDHTLRAAYLNVLTDVFISIIAIAALLSAKYSGIAWLDPVVGIAGAIIIFKWSFTLIKDTSIILLDNEIDDDKRHLIIEKMKNSIKGGIADIHIWKLGPADYAAIISIVTDSPMHPEDYKEILSEFQEITHITIEVNECKTSPCKVSRFKRLKTG